MKLNTIISRIFVVGVVIWSLGCFLIAFVGMLSDQKIDSFPDWLPVPWPGLTDFVEIPQGDVFLLSKFFPKLAQYNQAGQLMALYPVEAKEYPGSWQIAAGTDGTLYLKTSAAITRYSAEMEKLATMKLPVTRDVPAWTIGADGKPSPLEGESGSSVRPDRLIAPGELLFAAEPALRQQFSCHDGTILTRTAQGVERRTDSGMLVAQYGAARWMFPVQFPWPALLSWPLLFGLLIAHIVKRSHVRVIPRSASAQDMPILFFGKSHDNFQQLQIKLDETAPDEKNLFFVSDWKTRIKVILLLGVMSCMGVIAPIVLSIELYKRYAELGWLFWLWLLTANGPFIVGGLVVLWLMFYWLVGCEKLTINLREQTITFAERLVLWKFPNTVELNYVRRTAGLNQSRMFLDAPVTRGSRTFRQSRLSVMFDGRKTAIAKDYPHAGHQKVQEFLTPYLATTTTSVKPATLRQIVLTPAVLLLIGSLSFLAFIFSRMIWFHPQPIVRHTAVVTHSRKPLKNRDPDLTLRDQGDMFYALAFSHDGQTLVTGGHHSRIKLWAIHAGTEIYTISARDAIDQLTFLADDTAFMAGYMYKAGIEIREAATGKTRSIDQTNLVGFQDALADEIAFAPQVGLFAAGSAQDQEEIIRLWHLADGKALPTLHIPDDRKVSYVTSLALSADGQYLAVAYTVRGGGFMQDYNPPEIAVFNVSTGQVVNVLTGHGRYFIKCMEFTPDGKTLISGGHEDKQVIVWDIAHPEQSVTFKGHKYELSALAISPDGRWLASVAGDSDRGGFRPGDVLVWDLQARQGVATLPFKYPAETVAFSPDGQLLAVGGGYEDKGEVLIWQFNRIQQ